MIEFSGALWMPTTHFWTGRNGQPARWIILHGTAGFTTAQQVGTFFQSNNPPTSVHYVVGQDGTVVQCVLEENSAWGNGVLSSGHDAWWSDAVNPNLQTISIEHVKPDPNNATPLTLAQQKASFALVAYLCKKWGIPARAADGSGGVTGHYSIDPVNRAFCPGVYPWQALWDFLAGGTIKMAWTKMSDGRGLDSAGHSCGSGFMTELSATGDAAHDGLMSETYLPDKTSFLPLNNGQVYTYDGNVHTNQGAEVAVKLYGLYEAALKQAATPPVVAPTPPAPAPLSTSDQLAIEALAAIKAALAAN